MACNLLYMVFLDYRSEGENIIYILLNPNQMSQVGTISMLNIKRFIKDSNEAAKLTVLKH